MAAKKKEYKKAPGGRLFRLAGNDSLWIGADHLLAISSQGVTENYRRFYYKDIQAVILRRTPIADIINVILIVLAGLSLFPLVQGSESLAPWFFAGFFFFFLLINIWKGPSCTCHIQTAVQTEKLPSLGRLKTARKVLGLFKGHIDQVQGVLPREEIVSSMAAFSADGRSPLSGTAGGGVHHAVVLAKEEKAKTGFHKALFSLLLVSGALEVPNLSGMGHLSLFLLGSVIYLGTIICVIPALVNQYDTIFPSSLRTVTWASFVYVCLATLIGYIIYFSSVFLHPEIANNQWDMMRYLAGLSPADSPLLLVTSIMTLVCGLGLGAFGWVLVRRFAESSTPVHGDDGFTLSEGK